MGFISIFFLTWGLISQLPRPPKSIKKIGNIFSNLRADSPASRASKIYSFFFSLSPPLKKFNYHTYLKQCCVYANAMNPDSNSGFFLIRIRLFYQKTADEMRKHLIFKIRNKPLRPQKRTTKFQKSFRRLRCAFSSGYFGLLRHIDTQVVIEGLKG